MSNAAIELEVQQAQAAIKQVTYELSQLNVQDTQAAFRMGDLLNEAKKAYTSKIMQSIRINAGIEQSTANVRCWVSSKIPVDSPVRQFKSLSFSIFKELAVLPEEQQLQWAKKAEEDGLTVTQLRKSLNPEPEADGTEVILCPVTGVDLSTVAYPISIKVTKYAARVADLASATTLIQEYLDKSEADKQAKLEAAAAKEAEKQAAKAAKEAARAAEASFEEDEIIIIDDEEDASGVDDNDIFDE